MRVCEVCGAFLVVGDTDKRLQSHMEGKQHLGYERIRKTLHDLKNKHWNDPRDDRGRERFPPEKDKMQPRNLERDNRDNRDRRSYRDTERDNRDRHTPRRDTKRRERDEDHHNDKERDWERERLKHDGKRPREDN